ncbi:MAG: GyrI-like domain-containing protein [Candidatus Hermodarchaeota archaeon]
MEPEVLESKIFKLLGCVYYGDPFHSAKGWDRENEIGKTWDRFEKLYYKYKEFLDAVKYGEAHGYEVHIEPDDYTTHKKFHIFVGIEVKSLEFFPLEMFYKVFPESQYLFFTSEYMGKGTEYVFSQWLPESEYEPSYPFLMQSYHPDRWDESDIENSLMDWYVPIKPKEEDID